MKPLKLFFVTVMLILVACTHKSEVCMQLEIVDSLLCCDMIDSAVCIFNSIEPANESDSAYYFVLKGEIDYKQRVIADSVTLNYSIRYYKKHPNYRELALAHYYKAMIAVLSYSWSNNDVLLLKTAEMYAEKTSDNMLKDKIYSGLRFLNCVFENYDEALNYSKKELYYSQYLGNRDKAYAMLSLSTVYRELENVDSCEYYLLQCKRLLSDVDDENKAFVYNMLGESFLNENNDAALTYFRMALNYRRLPEIYKNIADLYYSLKDTTNWIIYCDSVLANASFEIQIDILNNMASMYCNVGDYPNFKNTVERLVDVHNKRFAEAKENNALEVQKKYDFERQSARYEKLKWMLVAVVCLFVAIVTIVLLLYKRKIYYSRQKMQRIESDNAILLQRLSATKEQINDYQVQIDYLTNQNAELNADSDNMMGVIDNNIKLIDSLKAKLGNLNREAEEALARGGEIYTLMVNNECINEYKNRWSDCLFFFEAKFPEQITIFSSYQNLTVSNMLFIICDDCLKKSDSQLSSIFSLSVSTIRSRRSKLKGKMS